MLDPFEEQADDTQSAVYNQAYQDSASIIAAGTKPVDYLRMRRELFDWGDNETGSFWKAYNAALRDPEVMRQKVDAGVTAVKADEISRSLPIVRDAVLGVDAAVSDIASTVFRPLDAVANLTGAPVAISGVLNRTQNRQERAAAMADKADGMGMWGTRMRGVTRSLATFAATRGMGANGALGMGAVFGAIRGNQAIDEADDAGVEGAAKWGYVGRAAAIEGGVMGAFHLAGLGGMESLLSQSLTRAGFKEIAKRTGIAMLQELPEENITELLDEYNQIVSHVSPGELTAERAWEIMKETSIQTIMATGVTSGVSGVASQDSLREREIMAIGIQRENGIPYERALHVLHEASQAGNNADVVLGQGIYREVLKTPEGLAEWVYQNPDVAKELSQLPHVGPSDMASRDLPAMNRRDRRAFVANLKEALAGPRTDSSPIDVLQGQTPVPSSAPEVTPASEVAPTAVTQAAAPAPVQPVIQPPASAPVATPAVDPTQTVAPAPVPAQAPPLNADARLPKSLGGAKPRYNYGQKKFTPEFQSDIDKALFIVGQQNKSRSDAKYRKWLEKQGMDASEIDAAAQVVRGQLKRRAQRLDAGQRLVVPPIAAARAAKQQKPAPAPQPAPVEPVQAPAVDPATTPEAVATKAPMTAEAAKQAQKDGKFVSIRDARESAGMSIEDVAKATGIKPEYIEMMERGDFEDLPTGKPQMAAMGARLYKHYGLDGQPFRDAIAKLQETWGEREYDRQQAKDDAERAERDAQIRRDEKEYQAKQAEKEPAEQPKQAEAKPDKPKKPAPPEKTGDLPTATAETHIMTPAGKAFTSRAAAKRAAKTNGLTDADVESVKGGFAVKRKAEAEVKPKAVYKNVGKNSDGAMVEEDVQGVRSILRDSGIRIQEGVIAEPQRDEDGRPRIVRQPSRRYWTSEFLTKEESDAMRQEEEAKQARLDAAKADAAAKAEAKETENPKPEPDTDPFESKILKDFGITGKRAVELGAIEKNAGKWWVTATGNMFDTQYDAVKDWREYARTEKADHDKRVAAAKVIWGRVPEGDGSDKSKGAYRVLVDGVEVFRHNRAMVLDHVEKLEKQYGTVSEQYTGTLPADFGKQADKPADQPKVMGESDAAGMILVNAIDPLLSDATIVNAVKNSTEDAARKTIQKQIDAALGAMLASDVPRFAPAFKATVDKDKATWVDQWTDYVYDNVHTAEAKKPAQSPDAAKTEVPAKPDANKLFTREQYEKDKAALIERMKRANMGIDPEILILGSRMASYHVEAGVRKFADFAKVMKSDIGEVWDVTRGYLHAFWSAAGEAMPTADLDDITKAQAREILNSIDSEANATDISTTSESKETTDGNESGKESDTDATPRSGSKPVVSPAHVDEAGDRGSADVLEREPAQDDGDAGKPKTGKAVRGSAGLASDAGDGPNGADAAERGRADGGPGPDATADAGDGGRPDTEPDAGVTEEAAPAKGRERKNYRITDPEKLVGGSQMRRFKANKAAIETYQRLRDTGQEPTKADLDTMAAYVGWGAFGQDLFNGGWDNPRPKPDWRDADTWLREQLGREAWESAQASIINAHYTDPITVQAIWKMVSKLGFSGGRILEPSAGVGNFFGLMPPKVEKQSVLTGIEMDEMTGGILAMLYPAANVHNIPYQESKTPDNFYDLVIGNWPFDETRIKSDRRYGKLSPTLHDYFFLKAMDQVRPGGLVIGITSTGTMDKVDTSVRLQLAKQATLVAAYRMPSGAFEKYAGTKVVTDLIILQKRENPGEIELGWLNPKMTATPMGEDVRVNEYYVANPDNVLGTLNYGHGTTIYRAGMVVDRPANYEQMLNDVYKKLPKVYEDRTAKSRISWVSNHTKSAYNSLTVDETGEVFVSKGEVKLPLLQAMGGRQMSAKTAKPFLKQVRDLIGLRDTISQLLVAQRDGLDTEAKLRKQANTQYDAFVKKHRTNLTDSDALSRGFKAAGEPSYYLMRALERKTEDGYEKADIFHKSTMRGTAKVDNPSISDAFILQRNEMLEVDIDRIAELAKKSASEVIDGLSENNQIFMAPDGSWEPREVYLSGNVRKKLREAQEMVAQGQKEYARNVKALEEVVPPVIPYYEIEARFGAPWVTLDDYIDFVGYLVSASDDMKKRSEVRPMPRGWRVAIPSDMARQADNTQWATPDVGYKRLIEAAINNTLPVVKRKDDDGNQYVDEEATALAATKVDAIREEFESWVWADEARKIKLQTIYNETMNAVSEGQWDGSHMTMEGMALEREGNEFSLRKHQMTAIYRGVMQGRSFNTHEVGTGKTYTIGGIAVESRRFGIAKKPLLFAHNANSATVAEEIRGMYPGAKILYVDNLQPSTRNDQLAQIATDDWDLIVVPHSLVDRFGLKAETLKVMLREDIATLEQEALLAASDDGVSLTVDDMDDDKNMKKVRSPTAKALVKERNKLLERIKAAAASATKEDSVFFEDLGVDMMLIDEVHIFNKPHIATKMRIKGLNTNSSSRSTSMELLTNYVKGLNGGRGIHAFTGTPITNTLNEMYNMMRIYMDSDMRELGIYRWDDWFNTFAGSSADDELTPAGEFDSVTRLRQFLNVPELHRIAGQYMDIVFADDMPEMVPRKTKSGKDLKDPTLTDAERDELLNGKAEGQVSGRPYKKIINSVRKMTRQQATIRDHLANLYKQFQDASGKTRMQIMRSGDERSPIMIETASSNAGLDPRLYDITLQGEPGSKADRAVNNILTHYAEHPQSTQMVFMERGTSDSGTKSQGRNLLTGEKNPVLRVDKFNMQKSMIDELVRGGIPREQIVVFDGSTSKEKRRQYAEDMNAGKVRVAFGNTQTMGTGVNAQVHLRAIHHMDAPWKPAELEQRNGRGQRQGNTWNTVLEYRYLTSKIDGRRWQVLAIKDHFIKSFMRGKNKRVIEGDMTDVAEKEDISESFSSAMGDPRVMQRSKLERDIERLNRKRQQHEQGVYDAREKIEYNTHRVIPRLKKLRDEYLRMDAVWKKRQEFSNDNLTATLMGKTAKGVEAIDAAFEKLESEIISGKHLPAKTNKPSSLVVGRFMGLDITIHDYVARGFITTNYSGVSTITSITLGDGHQMGRLSRRSAESVLRNSIKWADERSQEITSNEEIVSSLKESVNKPFARLDELTRKEELLSELTADMNDYPEYPGDWLTETIPAGVPVWYHGEERTVVGYRYKEDETTVSIADTEGNREWVPFNELHDENGYAHFKPDDWQRQNQSDDDDAIDDASLAALTLGNIYESTKKRPPLMVALQRKLQAFEDARQKAMESGDSYEEELPPDLQARIFDVQGKSGHLLNESDDLFFSAQKLPSGPEKAALLERAEDLLNRGESLSKYAGHLVNYEASLKRRLSVVEKARAKAMREGRDYFAGQTPSQRDGVAYRDTAEPLSTVNKARLKQLGRTLFGDDWLALRDQVLTPEGREVMGKYRDGWAEISTGKGDAEATVLHEAVHRAEDMFLTDAERADLEAAMPDPEDRAEGIVRYAREGSGIVGKARRIVGRLMRRLRRFVGAGKAADRLLDFYDRLLGGDFATRPPVRGDGFGQASMFRTADDTAYMDAVERGDMATAQRMVDEAAKAAGYTVTGYHGTAFKFTVPRGDRGVAVHVALNKGMADDFASSAAEHVAEMAEENGELLPDESLDPIVLHLVSRGTFFDPRNESHLADLAEALGEDKKSFAIVSHHEFEENDVQDALRGLGFDGYYEAESTDEITSLAVFDPENVKSADAITYDDAGNVIPLSERFNATNDDIRYRTEETVEKARQAWAASTSAAVDWVKAFIAKQPKDVNARPEISQFDRIARTISHFSTKVPALRRLFDSAQRLHDNKRMYAEDIFGPEEQDIGALSAFAKANPTEWKRLESYLWERDVNAVGYTVQLDDNGSFTVMNPDGVPVSVQSDEDAAWYHAYALEGQDLERRHKLTPDAVAMLRNVRMINHRMYRQLLGQAQELSDRLESLDLEMPLLDDGTDIFDALRRMGDRRGHYMPRLRLSGRYQLYAHKNDSPPIMETFATPLGRRARAATLKNQGYDITNRISDQPSEAAFLDLNLVAMNDLVNNALERLDKAGDDVSLKDFDMPSTHVTYTRKDGGTEDHLVITGPKRGSWAGIFKDFGGRHYDDGQNGLGAVWHFKNPQPGLERQLALAMTAHQYGAVDMTNAFAKLFTEQVAAIVHSHGSRSRKIGRNDATGDDVYRGYEMDAVRALALAGKATAGGTAKRQMAREMAEIVTGTDIAWSDYRESYVKDNEISDPDGFDFSEAWGEYQGTVNDRRIDSATQPNAYKEARSFMTDMLRNEEPSERVFGTIKGIAALKFLSGIAPGVVNLTALATTVPAAMAHFGNVPMHKTARLLGRGVNEYVRGYVHARWGKGEAPTGENAWLYHEISRRGWDDAVMNTEALNALQGQLRGAWGRLVDFAMVPFSVTERVNRGGTLTALYHGLRQQGMEQEEALTKAKEISDKAHGVYGKENLPSWARGSGVGSQVARSWYMYKTFSHNYLDVAGQMGYDSLFGGDRKKSAKAFAWMISSPAILGGAGSMAGVGIISAMIKGLLSLIPGVEPPDDPEEWLYRGIEDTMGAIPGRFARYGAGGLAGVNLKGSLAVGVGDLPTKTSDLLGAPYSLLQDTGRGLGNLASGNMLKGMEQLAPRFLASPIRAVRENTEGVTTHNNQPVFYGNERLRADWYDSLLRSLSFNPASISTKREKQWKERDADNRFRDMRTDIYASIRRFALSGNGSKAAWANILMDIEEYNARVRVSGWDHIAFITESQIKSTLTKMDAPDRREKIRAGTATRVDPGAIAYAPKGTR